MCFFGVFLAQKLKQKLNFFFVREAKGHSPPRSSGIHFREWALPSICRQKDKFLGLLLKRSKKNGSFVEKYSTNVW